MITIYTRDGNQYNEIPLSYEVVCGLLYDDSIIGRNNFIEIIYPDGAKALIRKRDISGVYYDDEQDA